MSETPAFPTHGPTGETIQGMTLRDYFAAAALPSTIAIVYNGKFITRKTPSEDLAALAWEMADAMLAERLK